MHYTRPMSTTGMGQALGKEEVIDLLQKCGINTTQQRVEIARMLFAEFQHLSAEQVLEMVNRDHPAVSKATVYNTLNLFARKGLVREVIVDPSKVFYDSNTTPHHHLFNLDTGELSDVDEEWLAITGLPELPEGTHPVGVDVIVRVRNQLSD